MSDTDNRILVRSGTVTFEDANGASFTANLDPGSPAVAAPDTWLAKKPLLTREVAYTRKREQPYFNPRVHTRADDEDLGWRCATYRHWREVARRHRNHPFMIEGPRWFIDVGGVRVWFVRQYGDVVASFRIQRRNADLLLEGEAGSPPERIVHCLRNHPRFRWR